MSVYYVDPSAWVKRYFQEAGTDRLLQLFEAADAVVCSQIGLIEVAATVARKGKFEHLPATVLEGILRDVRTDFAEAEIVVLDEQLNAAAALLAFRHSLRAGDAIHLASALHVAASNLGVPLQLISADLELLAAANSEGLLILDPTKSM